MVGGCCSAIGLHVGEDAVLGEIGERTGVAPVASGGDIDPTIWVDWQDGLSEEEAALLALYRSARFQELMAELEITWADLLTAGQLANPQVTSMFPVGAKDFEFALLLPMEVLLTRPRRIDAAAWQARRIGKRLVQDGLDVMRDARTAHADAWLASERHRLAEANARLREETARLTLVRKQAGDASELDVSTARLDAQSAREAADRLVYDERVAEERLRLVIGAGVDEPVDRLLIASRPVLDASVEELLQQALGARPDLASATLALREAESRLRLSLYDNFLARVFLPDVNSPGENGFEVGPGIQATLPIFHQNQGARARARAELERLERRRRTVHDTIIFEVRTAHLRVLQAQYSLNRLEESELPLAEAVSVDSERAFREGAQSLIMALESNRLLLNSQLRAAEGEAELRRAFAELERAVGGRLRPGLAGAAPEELPVPQSITPSVDNDAEVPVPPPADEAPE